MSRTFRRPMFRGGKVVSSYGNGIATGLANGGRVNLQTGGAPIKSAGGESTVTGGSLMNNLRSANSLFFNDPMRDLQDNKTLFGMNVPGTGMAVDDEGVPFDEEYTKEVLKENADEMTTILSLLPAGRALKGANMMRSGLGMSRTGLPSASKVKDFFTKSPQSSSKQIGPFKGPAPVGTDRFFAEKLRPAFQNTGAALKDLLGGAGKLKDYKAAIGIGGVGGGVGLAKGYEAFKERQKGLEETLEQQLTNKLNPTTEAENNPGKQINVNPTTGEPTETVTGKKARLKKAAKEYEEILGEGIKKESIFDAMIAGGAAATQGDDLGSILQKAGKKLDPIQGVKTASRKLAVEEDIALRRAKAIAATKRTATADLIQAYRDAGKNPSEIADLLSKQNTSLGDEVQKLGKTEGYKEFVRKTQPGVKITEFTEVKDIEKKASELADGVYYVSFPGDTFVQIKDKKVIAKKRRGG